MAEVIQARVVGPNQFNKSLKRKTPDTTVSLPTHENQEPIVVAAMLELAKCPRINIYNPAFIKNRMMEAYNLDPVGELLKFYKISFQTLFSNKKVCLMFATFKNYQNQFINFVSNHKNGFTQNECAAYVTLNNQLAIAHNNLINYC